MTTLKTHQTDRWRLEWTITPNHSDEVLLIDRTNYHVMGRYYGPDIVSMFIDFASDPREWRKWPIAGDLGPADENRTTLAVTNGDKLRITADGRREDAFFDRLAFLGIAWPHAFAFETEDTRARWRELNTPDLRPWLAIADEIFGGISDPLKSGRRCRAISALAKRLGKTYQHEDTRAIAARLMLGAEWREYQRNAQQ